VLHFVAATPYASFVLIFPLFAGHVEFFGDQLKNTFDAFQPFTVIHAASVLRLIRTMGDEWWSRIRSNQGVKTGEYMEAAIFWHANREESSRRFAQFRGCAASGM
jgi:hypothetical protein